LIETEEGRSSKGNHRKKVPFIAGYLIGPYINGPNDVQIAGITQKPSSLRPLAILLNFIFYLLSNTKYINYLTQAALSSRLC
jgi:hypothetical protein